MRVAAGAVRRAGRVSSAAAPLLLVGGWTLAASRQPAFDPTRETISALAALDATDRAVMTAALAGLGACHVTTAWSLRPAAPAGRLLLAAGGAATLLVAALPLPAGDGASLPHGVAAAAAFGALSAWPALAARRGTGVPALRPRVALAATAVLTGLVAWFAGELAVTGDRIGLAERAAAAAQAVWPLVVVGSAARAGGAGR